MITTRNPLALGNLVAVLAGLLLMLVGGASAWALNETISLRDRATKLEGLSEQFQQMRIENKDEHREMRAALQELLQFRKTAAAGR